MKLNAGIKGWLNPASLILAGALLPFALAPYGVWPLALVSTALLCSRIQNVNSKHCVYRAFLYGLGLFGHGVSWVYISIHDFGFTGAPLAALMTAVFVAFLALVFSLPFYLFGKINRKHIFNLSFGFSAIWVLGEWLRSWLFSGFPWLFVGYAQIESPLAALAPIGGVFLLSFLSLLVANIFWLALKEVKNIIDNRSLRRQKAIRLGYLGSALVAVLIVSLGLKNVEWTSANASPQSISIVQPNVALIRKWDPYFFPGIMNELDDAADRHWDSDIQLWPEAAIPSLYYSMQDYIDDIGVRANASNTNVISGVLYDNPEPYEVYNSIIGMGAASGVYFKQKLVPFGEYVPFEDMLRGLITFFDLPNSVIRRGPYRPSAISAKTQTGHQYIVAPFICYEVVYPDFVAANAQDAELLVTISNDAWFGKSIGPHQHFEMVRMRALENQKYFARATNTGISAIINHHGEVLVKGEQFTQEVISGEVQLRSGVTPYARTGSAPIIIFCIAVLGFACTRLRNNECTSDT